MPERTTRQTLLFSATLSHRVLELAYEHMNDPEKLVVETEHVTADRVRQRVYFPANEEKIPLLLGLLSRSEGARTMVFVNTKAWVEKVARALDRAGYRVGVLSGDVPQKKRESLLARFQKGQLEVLVATDVAARGLHIDGIKYVYNYDLPFDAEDYVHRIGRTARLGEEGDAISFACELYAMSLPDIEQYIGMKIPVETVTRELLTALPRPERAAPAAGEEDDAEGESIGEIFREVREQKAAEGQRRGGRDGRPARGPRREGEGEPRRRRAPRAGVEGAPAATAAAASDATPVAAPDVTENAAAPDVPAEAVAAESGEGKAPRKRRRRRKGRPVDAAPGSAPTAGEAAAAPAIAVAGERGRDRHAPRPAGNKAAPLAAHKPVQVVAKPAGVRGESFLTRLGRRLRSLVSGS
jgi:ATP-dependent RNA helicase RhlB